MLLLHLCNLLGVLLVHQLQLSQHSFTALAQSLFIIDQLKNDRTHFRTRGKTETTCRKRLMQLGSDCGCSHLINEREVSLDGGFILFLLELEVSVQLLLRLLHMSHRQLPLLGLMDTRGDKEDEYSDP